MEHFTGTKPVAASHAFDIAALEVWLQRELPGFAGPLAVEQLKVSLASAEASVASLRSSSATLAPATTKRESTISAGRFGR